MAQDGLKAGHQPSRAQRPLVIPTVGVQASVFWPKQAVGADYLPGNTNSIFGSKMELLPRFFLPPEQSYYLFGPRGIGKSSWTVQRHPDALLIDLLQPDVLRRYQGYPERIRDTVHALSDGQTIIIDEVQRVPEILGAVHALIEEKRGWRFVLTGSSSRKLRKSGVYQSLRPKGPLDRTDEIAGAALEGLVAQHLRAWIGYGRVSRQLYFWRTQGGSEVDFIVYGETCFWALEVKHTRRVNATDLRGLPAFMDEYPEAKPVLLYQGRERQVVNGILCLPCAEFLRSLTPGTDPL